MGRPKSKDRLNEFNYSSKDCVGRGHQEIQDTKPVQTSAPLLARPTQPIQFNRRHESSASIDSGQGRGDGDILDGKQSRAMTIDFDNIDIDSVAVHYSNDNWASEPIFVGDTTYTGIYPDNPEISITINNEK